METAYRAVSFKNHDTMTRDLMDQVQQNLQYIKDNTPRGRLYKKTDRGILLQDELLVVIGGKVRMPRNRKSPSTRASVRFGAAFDPRCNPNVTISICADAQRTIFAVVNGPAGKNLPDSTGFEVLAEVQDDPRTKKPDAIKKDFSVHWIAMGFRTDDMNEF